MQIQDAVVLVTGAGRGLGRATAEMLTDQGATVVAIDQRFDARDRVGHLQMAVDVTDPAAVGAAVDSGVDQAGPLRAVVHCAGVAAGFKLLGHSGPADPARFREVVEVNLLGTFHVLRSCAGVMQDNEAVDGERGVMVTTTSIAAFEGQQGQMAYAASKAAVAAMTLPVARELGQLGLRCVSIAPGAFATTLTTDLEQPLQEHLTSSAAFPRRLGRPEEFADLACATIRNPMLNGEVIRLDGGARLGQL